MERLAERNAAKLDRTKRRGGSGFSTFRLEGIDQAATVSSGRTHHKLAPVERTRAAGETNSSFHDAPRHTLRCNLHGSRAGAHVRQRNHNTTTKVSRRVLQG